jgi:single-strand DNA-binding protein
MNKVILMGRLTRDPELRNTTSQIPVASFTIAIDRKFKNAAGEKQADFINCVAWRQTAEFIAKYFHKGSKIIVDGSLQSRSWDGDDGKKHSATEVVVENAEFADSKPSDNQSPVVAGLSPVSNSFFPDTSTDLPFDI